MFPLNFVGEPFSPKRTHTGHGGGSAPAWILATLHKKNVSPPVVLHFKQADNWSVGPFQAHVVSSLLTSPLFTHMCISQEILMLCLAFNTPSCKSKAARQEAVRTPLTSLGGWRIYGRVLSRERSLSRHPLTTLSGSWGGSSQSPAQPLTTCHRGQEWRRVGVPPLHRCHASSLE